MYPVPQDLLDEIDEAEAERGGAEDASNSALHVMFFMANELGKAQYAANSSSTGVEVYPLPPPWAYSAPLNLTEPIIPMPWFRSTGNDPRKTARSATTKLSWATTFHGGRHSTAVGENSATVWSVCNDGNVDRD
jgi:hypothetical protein